MTAGALLVQLEQMHEPEGHTNAFLSSNRKEENAMSMPITYIGVDVAKDELCWNIQGETLGTPNTPAGCAIAFKKIKKLPQPIQVVCEPSGGYERALLDFCWAKAHPVSLVNAERVRYHAKAGGQLAKNDPIDASVIADYGRAHNPAPTPAPSPEQCRMQELARTRHGYIQQIQQLRNQREHLRQPDLERIQAMVIQSLKVAVAKVDAAIRDMVQASPDWMAKVKRQCQVKGVGWITACCMLAFLPELGTLGDAQAAALAGLAPYDDDSGKNKGKRTIRGGRFAARQSLYMAALTAVSHNPIFKAVYKRLRKAGKPAKVALTAVMRKLVILLNRLLRNPDFVLSQ